MNNIIGKRIKKLRQEKNIKQKEIAQELSCMREVVSYYENGQRNISVTALIKLAKLFNVSSDYLLGLSDVKSTDTNIKSICDYTGLSETAINNLHNSTQNNRELCEEIIAVICKK